NTKKFKKNAVKYLENYNFAFVSRYLSILEALAAKRLAFALYDNPIKEDYLRMSPFSGYIVIENSPKKLAERVDYYLRNRQAEEELIEKGFSWVTNQTWENVVGAYLRLWR
ncbi:MAG: Glycosyltransferase, group 1 family protein, partial [Candidatus Levybacteria bacterium GW2011_GWA2_41_15]